MKHFYSIPDNLKHIIINLIVAGPTSDTAEMLKTGRREVPGSNSGHACRPSRSEFSVVFYETCVNTG